MASKQIIWVAICVLVFSCTRERLENVNVSNATAPQAVGQDINIQNTQLNSKTLSTDENTQVNLGVDNPQISVEAQRLNYFLENIEGFYAISGYLFGESNESYLVFINIVENVLVISRFSIVNNQSFYDELIRFDINSNDITDGVRLTNEDYRFSVSFDRNNSFSRIILSLFLHGIRNWSEDQFFHISNEIEDVFRFTHDYQKQFAGVFERDSHTFFGMSEDEFQQNRFPPNKIIISVSENGTLFYDDGLGNDQYGFPRFRVHNMDVPIIIFGNNPGSGFSNIMIYFYNDEIFHEENFNQLEDSWESGFQFVYKRIE